MLSLLRWYTSMPFPGQRARRVKRISRHMVQCLSIDQLCPSHRQVLRFHTFPPPRTPIPKKVKVKRGGGREAEKGGGGALQTYVVPLDKGGALLEAGRDTDRLELESVDSWLCPSHWRQHIETSQLRREGKGRRWWWRWRRPGKTRALSKELAWIAYAGREKERSSCSCY